MLGGPAYDKIIFCWVMHQQSILDHILASLPLEDVRVKAFSLICDERDHGAVGEIVQDGVGLVGMNEIVVDWTKKILQTH